MRMLRWRRWLRRALGWGWRVGCRRWRRRAWRPISAAGCRWVLLLLLLLLPLPVVLVVLVLLLLLLLFLLLPNLSPSP